MNLKKTLENAKDAILGTSDEEVRREAEKEAEKDADPAAVLGLGYHGIFSMRDTVEQNPDDSSMFSNPAPGTDTEVLPASEFPAERSTTLPASEDPDHTVGT